MSITGGKFDFNTPKVKGFTMGSVDIEIDTKLYITCRLCLEDLSNQDTGVYQIVPAVREQITYCFDIVVEPFDGLPQLLCKKCKLLLNEYSTKKKDFTEKQDYLKQKLKIKKDILAPKSLPSPACSENNVGEMCKSEQESEKIKPNKRRKSSSSTDTVESSKCSKKKRRSGKYHDEKLITNLRKNYRKNFVCRICPNKYKNKKSVLKHCRKQHTSIRQKHIEIFKQKCMVYLDKIDNKHNTTGLRNTVAISQDKVVQDVGKQLYYILYLPRIKHGLNIDAESESFVNGVKNVCSDSSDEDIISSSRRKRLRLDSRSSNDTVCIDGNETNGPDVLSNSNKSKTVQPNTKSDDDKLFGPKDTVCINIDDSSDSDTATNSNVCLKKTVNSFDIKTIESIISVCRNKYEARFKRALSSDSDKAQIESQLKHKILSIGRKTINRQGFSHCTGLLRYLEHKNLNVKWEAKSQMLALAAKETNFVRILTKMDSSWNSADEPGWVDVPEKNKEQEPVNSVITISVSTPPPAAVKQPDAVPSPPQISQTSPRVDEQPDTDQAVLYQCFDDHNTTKLLNPNPVANPKQLPKKVHMHDTKPMIINNRLPTESLLVSSSEQIDESNMLMPVITSTTSLAGKLTEESNENSNSKSVNHNSDKPIPRIRIKPVSELMKPESMLNITPNHATNVWNFNRTQNEQIDHDNSQNIYVPNNLVSQIQSQSTSLPSSNALPVEKITSEPNKLSSEFMTLHSVDLPNTKTESPFKYFRNLLLLHGLVLTEANATVTRDFVCLLKFKVQFRQENKAHPVTLCLSLFCSENTFCMSIKDSNLINIHMAKMSANWQWEIMKVYQGNVAEKILQNAQKAGVDVHNHTRTFVYLLKSINQI